MLGVVPGTEPGGTLLSVDGTGGSVELGGTATPVVGAVVGTVAGVSTIEVDTVGLVVLGTVTTEKVAVVVLGVFWLAGGTAGGAVPHSVVVTVTVTVVSANIISLRLEPEEAKTYLERRAIELPTSQRP